MPKKAGNLPVADVLIKGLRTAVVGANRHMADAEIGIAVGE